MVNVAIEPGFKIIACPACREANIVYNSFCGKGKTSQVLPYIQPVGHYKYNRGFVPTPLPAPEVLAEEMKPGDYLDIPEAEEEQTVAARAAAGAQ